MIKLWRVLVQIKILIDDASDSHPDQPWIPGTSSKSPNTLEDTSPVLAHRCGPIVRNIRELSSEVTQATWSGGLGPPQVTCESCGARREKWNWPP